MSTVISALVFAVFGYFLGQGVGLNGLPSALVVGAAGTSFGLLMSSVGARALWLPVAGAALGLIGVVVVQVLSSPVGFGFEYYIFIPILVAVLITLPSSVLLAVFPSLRRRVFRSAQAVPD